MRFAYWHPTNLRYNQRAQPIPRLSPARSASSRLPVGCWTALNNLVPCPPGIAPCSRPSGKTEANVAVTARRIEVIAVGRATEPAAAEPRAAPQHTVGA